MSDFPFIIFTSFSFSEQDSNIIDTRRACVLILSIESGLPFCLGELCLKNEALSKFLLWLSKVRTLRCLCKDAGLITGLAQWVKDLLWLWHR